MKWIKPTGVSKYHAFIDGETLCKKNFVVDTRAVEGDETSQPKCEECEVLAPTP